MKPADQIRAAAEADLEVFIRLVHPNRVLGSIHEEIIDWWERENHSSHQLLLMPRDHMKSALVAYRVAWYIVKNPAIRVLYISSTANLATKQLGFIKDILTCDAVRRYWPELINKEEANRTKWTETEISVDHPLRKAENVRDPTIFTAGLTTTVTGLHCDIQVLDDVVVKENAQTEEGRDKVAAQYSLLASIASGDCQQWVVGTRYHPNDLYNELIKMEVDTYDIDNELVGQYNLYEIFRDGDCVVENSPSRDGSGEYLWPVQRRKDGKRFGFNQSILAKKRSQYLDRTQFYAQYYNDPNDPAGTGIDTGLFQYYDRAFLHRTAGQWYFKGRRLNVFAAIDFAYTMGKKSDYTAIVVVGIDSDRNYYVLDIDRFKSEGLVSEYFKHILTLHQKWDFRKIRAEVTVAQIAIVNTLKQEHIRQHGLALAIDEFRPGKAEGSKEERVNSILQPRYSNKQIWHYKGGNCQTLEEELVLERPAHDDCKDALASAVDICMAPSTAAQHLTLIKNDSLAGMTHPRFGGIV
jgi:phage terminase large subunit-like protein